MKILSSIQIREADQFTIKNEPVSSLDLMERASSVFCFWFRNNFQKETPVKIVCGIGNNGGDGLCVARILGLAGYGISTYIVEFSTNHSPDFRANLTRLQNSGLSKIFFINESNFELFEFSNCLLIDAIWGSGLSREPEGFAASLIEKINQSGSTIISIDIPSGLFADQHTPGVSVHAKHTFSFQGPKMAFMLPENEAVVGQWHFGSIGLSDTFIHELDCDQYYILRKDVERKLITRPKFGHKGTFGHVLTIGGSKGKVGAIALTAESSLKSGAGLCTIACGKQSKPILQKTLPEAMLLETGSGEEPGRIRSVETFSAIAIGPGMGKSKTAIDCLKSVLKLNTPTVIDADALNMISENPELKECLQPDSILTPHPGELKRLLGNWENDFHKIELAKEFSVKFSVIVVVKGAHTMIVAPNGKLFFNSTGNPGMATGGSGDILAGVIVSLLGQGYQPLDATIAGVYIHGMAGDLAAAREGEIGMTAHSILQQIPEAFQALKQGAQAY